MKRDEDKQEWDGWDEGEKGSEKPVVGLLLLLGCDPCVLGACRANPWPPSRPCQWVPICLYRGFLYGPSSEALILFYLIFSFIPFCLEASVSLSVLDPLFSIFDFMLPNRSDVLQPGRNQKKRQKSLSLRFYLFIYVPAFRSPRFGSFLKLPSNAILARFAFASNYERSQRPIEPVRHEPHLEDRVEQDSLFRFTSPATINPIRGSGGYREP